MLKANLKAKTLSLKFDLKIVFFTRYCSADEHCDILGNTNLFFLNSPSWNDLRSRLTPLFSSGKIKHMFHLMKNIGDQLNEAMESTNINEKTKTFCADVKDLCTRYTIDVIASCAYGLEVKSLKFPDGDFVTYGRKIFEFNLFRAFEFFAVFFMPELVSLFRFKVNLVLLYGVYVGYRTYLFQVFSKETTDFLRESINFVLNEREKSGNARQDLIDTLLVLKNEDKGKTQSGASSVGQSNKISSNKRTPTHYRDSFSG